MSGENITHRIEPWQSESLSEMFPHGTEMAGGREEVKWSGTPCQFDSSETEKRERERRHNRRGT